METAIAAWGNSSAIRIPRKILKSFGSSIGDVVELRLNSSGNIEISKATTAHRIVKPEEGVTFDTLFAGYDGKIDTTPAWPDDTLVGAEIESWQK